MLPGRPWWTGYVISNKGDRLHSLASSIGGGSGGGGGGGGGGGAGDDSQPVDGREEGDVQVAFLKPPVGEGGYGYYKNSDLRRALEWDR